MAESLYSEQEWAQFRGPTTSENYNKRVENLYKDLVAIKNRVGLLQENAYLNRRRFVRDHFHIMKMTEDMLARLETLEMNEEKLIFSHTDQVDTDRFDGTDFEILENDRLTWDSQHGLMLLPRVTTSSVSKVRFANTNGQTLIPPSLEAIATGTTGTADTPSAFIDSSDIMQAILQDAGAIWERNVVVDAPDVDHAEVTLYMRLPTDYAINEDTNCIIIHPYPMMGCDIVDVAYSTDTSVVLNETDGYTPINEDGFYDGDTLSVGWVAPGGWGSTDDIITNSGPKAFYFDPKPVTGIRIKLRQRHYWIENLKYVYSYGLSHLDVRYDKFRETGKTIVRYDMPSGYTISQVGGVSPNIYNVSNAELDDIFSYRVIWETSYDSGVYTLEPVADSTRVWIEVTLNKTLGKGSPALARLAISPNYDFIEVMH